MSSPEPLLPGGKYRPSKILGSGSYGIVYFAKEVRTGKVAVKVEEPEVCYPTLMSEHKIMSSLQGLQGIPKIKCFEESDDHKLMAMELLGPDLWNLLQYCGGPFTTKTVLMLADQMISLLERVHDRHYIHRDLKPDNFAMGGPAHKANQVYLIDFGLSKRYRDERDNLHIPYRKDPDALGTNCFSSINTHRGFEQSRRDDMEALGYLFIYLQRGSLPWQETTGATPKQLCDKIVDVKSTISLKELCAGLPDEYAKYLEHCRELGFYEMPDYAEYRKWFRALFSRLKYKHDFEYDWIVRRNMEEERKREKEEGAVAAGGVDNGQQAAV